jgi:hypothetical protein
MKGDKGDQVKELQEDQLSMMIVRLVNKTTLSIEEDAHFAAPVSQFYWSNSIESA